MLANGDAIFCEYTRRTTYTCNVWKLSGDPLDPDNWSATKQFVITTEDNNTLFKHAHMVAQDFYTGICYFATGDDDIGAMLWASDDNGDTWTQLVAPDSDGEVNEYGYINGSQKYCRMLMLTFTKDYIYWATDSSGLSMHYLFRCERDENNILDYSTVSEIANLAEYGVATYGTALIPELNAILILDRCDSANTQMKVKLVKIVDGSVIEIGKMYSVTDTPACIGFRTRFSEWYPINGCVRLGFDTRTNRLNDAVNHNKGFGNKGENTSGSGTQNINNLVLQVVKDGSDYRMAMHTNYI